jgi:hypothetical protein
MVGARLATVASIEEAPMKDAEKVLRELVAANVVRRQMVMEADSGPNVQLDLSRKLCQYGVRALGLQGLERERDTFPGYRLNDATPMRLWVRDDGSPLPSAPVTAAEIRERRLIDDD